MRIIQLNKTISTNQDLTQLCEKGDEEISEFTTICTDFQTAGKGQRGNSWESEEGKNLLFSFVLFPRFLEVRRQFILSQLITLAIKEELECITGNICIKWPNDIYWQDKKLCGILIENDLSGQRIARCIAGIGININQDTFLSDAPNPVSLKQITGRENDREALLHRILTRIESYYEQLKNACRRAPDDAGLAIQTLTSQISERYIRSLFRREGIHLYRDAGGDFNARLLRVEPDGRFVLQDTEGRERKYLFKEVQYIL